MPEASAAAPAVAVVAAGAVGADGLSVIVGSCGSSGPSWFSVPRFLRRDLDVAPGPRSPGVQHHRVLLCGLQLGKVHKHLQQQQEGAEE